jgi:hypothetical protein
MSRSVFKVDYYILGGQPKSELVCAETGEQAAHWAGVRDGHASIHPVLSDVQVAVLDPARPALPALAVHKAPPAPEPQVTRKEYEALLTRLRDLEKKGA